MIVSQGALILIRCLSGGEVAQLTMPDYQLPKFDTEVQRNYDNYLYEQA